MFGFNKGGQMRRPILAITLGLLLTASPAAAEGPQLPDRAKTPGAPLLTYDDPYHGIDRYRPPDE
jgi:hypothetical protein